MKTTGKWSKMLLVGMISMVLSFGLALTGCGDPSGGPNGTGNNNGTGTGDSNGTGNNNDTGTGNNNGTGETGDEEDDGDPLGLGGNSKETATILVKGGWTTGTELSETGESDWFKFNARSGKTYSLQWDNKGQGSSNYTCYIVVSAYQADGATVLNGINNIENGWDANMRIISGYTGTVYIRVKGYSSSSTGTYIIRYQEWDSNDTKETATPLSNSTWTNGTKIYPQGDFDWYKFEADSSKTYKLTWDDKGQGSSNYTCYIVVSAYQADGATVLNGINNIENGYSSPLNISGYTGTVYIRVKSLYSDGTGTYIIKYTEN